MDFEMKRYIKMPCKWVSVSIGAPLWSVRKDLLAGTFWVPFLDPEDIKMLSLGAIWNFGKGTGLY
jgi:hypothetical protein